MLSLGKDSNDNSVCWLNIFILVFIRNDWRLSFVNLKTNEKRKNIVGSEEKDQIWIPNLVFDNSVKDTQVKNDEFAVLQINQKSNGFLQVNDELQENLEYNGTLNNLRFSRSYKLSLLCDFELHYYPFDSQVCSIKVSHLLSNWLVIILVIILVGSLSHKPKFVNILYKKAFCIQYLGCMKI